MAKLTHQASDGIDRATNFKKLVVVDIFDQFHQFKIDNYGGPMLQA